MDYYTNRDALIIPRHIDLAVDFLRRARTDETREARKDHLSKDGVLIVSELIRESMQRDDLSIEDKLAAESILHILGDETLRSHKQLMADGEISAYKYGEAHRRVIQDVGTTLADQVRDGKYVPVIVPEHSPST